MSSDQVAKKLKKGFKSILYMPDSENTDTSFTTWSDLQNILFLEDATLNKAATKQYAAFIEQIREINLLQKLWSNLKTPNAPVSSEEASEKKQMLELLQKYFQKVQSGITKDDLSWNLQATAPISQMSEFMELVMKIKGNS